MSPCTEIMNHHGHRSFLDRIVPLGIIKLSAFKGNWMTLLH